MGASAFTGMAGSALSSVVYGQNVAKGLGSGAISGLIGFGVAMSTQVVVEDLAIVIEDQLVATKKIKSVKGRVTYKLRGSRKRFFVKLKSATELNKLLNTIVQNGDKITFFEYVGHGFDDGSGLQFGTLGGGVETGPTDFESFQEFGRMGLDDLPITEAFDSKATIQLEACKTATDSTSIAYAFKAKLPNAKVWGFTGYTKRIPILFVSETHTLFNWGSSWVEAKNRR